MKLEETYLIERTKWDKKAAHSLASLEVLPDAENFYTHAERASTMVGVTEFLGNIRDKHVLEYGCGLGESPVLLAKSGAYVTSFDLSTMSTMVTRQRSRLNNVESNIQLSVAAGERLPYADDSFDVVFGRAILHHLDVDLGWMEIGRVLKPGGKAVFVEPMGMNPLLNFVRDHVPYPHKNPRGADHPLTYQDINKWGEGVNGFWYREIQLLSMLERGLGFGRQISLLRRIDDFLLKHIPFFRRFCRYVVMYYNN